MKVSSSSNPLRLWIIGQSRSSGASGTPPNKLIERCGWRGGKTCRIARQALEASAIAARSASLVGGALRSTCARRHRR